MIKIKKSKDDQFYYTVGSVLTTSEMMQTKSSVMKSIKALGKQFGITLKKSKEKKDVYLLFNKLGDPQGEIKVQDLTNKK